MTKFNVGDLVKVIPGQDHFLIPKEAVRVVKAEGQFVYINPDDLAEGWWDSRFELAKAVDEKPLDKLIAETVDYALANYAHGSLRSNLIVDLVDNLNRRFNIK